MQQQRSSVMFVQVLAAISLMSLGSPAKSEGFRSPPLETMRRVVERTDAELLTPKGIAFSICGSNGALLRVFAGASKVHPRVYATEKQMDARSFAVELSRLLEPVEKLHGVGTKQTLHRWLVSQIAGPSPLQGFGYFVKLREQDVFEGSTLMFKDVRTKEQLTFEGDSWQDDCD